MKRRSCVVVWAFVAALLVATAQAQTQTPQQQVAIM